VTALPAALLFGVVPLGGIKKRVVAVLPARLLVPVTCLPRGGSCAGRARGGAERRDRPFLCWKAGPDGGGSWPAAHIGCRHERHAQDALGGT
jgi:hypothetical protein